MSGFGRFFPFTPNPNPNVCVLNRTIVQQKGFSWNEANCHIVTTQRTDRVSGSLIEMKAEEDRRRCHCFNTRPRDDP